MEIKLEYATMNILDFRNQKIMGNFNYIDTAETAIDTFLTDLIKKSFKSSKLRKLQLIKNSPLSQRLTQYTSNSNLIKWSNDITTLMFNYMKQGIFNTFMYVIGFEVVINNDHKHIGLLFCEEKPILKHNFNDEEINLEENSSIGNSISYFLAVNLETNDIKVIERPTEYDGEIISLIADKICQTVSTPSDEETFKELKRAIIKTSQDFEGTGVDEIKNLYTFLTKNAEVQQSINIEEAINTAFKGEPSKAAEAKTMLKDRNMLQTLPFTPEFAEKKSERIKIKTDTGVEISFPTEYLNSESITIEDDGNNSYKITILGNKLIHR